MLMLLYQTKKVNMYKILIASIIATSGYCVENNQEKDVEMQIQKIKDRQKYEQVISEYRDYLRSVPQTVRSEIEDYRNKVKEINTQKIELYKKLSQEAQQYLAKEREVKKTLSKSKNSEDVSIKNVKEVTTKEVKEEKTTGEEVFENKKSQ